MSDNIIWIVNEKTQIVSAIAKVGNLYFADTKPTASDKNPNPKPRPTLVAFNKAATMAEYEAAAKVLNVPPVYTALRGLCVPVNNCADRRPKIKTAEELAEEKALAATLAKLDANTRAMIEARLNKPIGKRTTTSTPPTTAKVYDLWPDAESVDLKR